MPIFRRKKCIITASGIVTLCKRLYSMPDENRLCRLLSQHLVSSLSVQYSTVCRMRADSAESAVIRPTVQPFTDSDNTRCCDNTVCPPEDEHVTARNMSRIII